MGKISIPTRDEIFEEIKELLYDFTGFPEEAIKLETELEELSLDSLDMVEISMDLEVRYQLDDIDEDKLEECKKVSDLVELVYQEIKNAS